MLVVPAYAKVNLALEVLGRRPDGFHELSSVVVTIDWHDLVGLRIDLAPRAGAAEASVDLAGPGVRDVPAGAANLAARAAAELARLAGRRLGIALWLDKQVPVGAGLGGGSADAAAVLRAGAALLARSGIRLHPNAIQAAAAGIGSDVPVLLAGGGATLVQGRGERLTPLPDAARLHLAVAVTAPSSTAAAYAGLGDAERRGEGRRSHRVADALRAGTLPGDSILGSDLEPAASRAAPELAAALDGLRATVPEAQWHLTGSGGAAFSLVADPAGAARLATAARRAGYPARACRTLPFPVAEPLAPRREAEHR